MRVPAERSGLFCNHSGWRPIFPLLVSGGASIEMIGKLLGHTQIGTTQRYAHLIESPLRAGVNAVGEMLRPRLKVVGE